VREKRPSIVTALATGVVVLVVAVVLSFALLAIGLVVL
jgi:hypothetical protein